jgi:hypothetical protein
MSLTTHMIHRRDTVTALLATGMAAQLPQPAAHAAILAGVDVTPAKLERPATARDKAPSIPAGEFALASPTSITSNRSGLPAARTMPAAREYCFGQPFGPGRKDPNCGWTVRQKNWDKFH